MLRFFPLGCVILLHLGWQLQIANANPIIMINDAISFSFETYERVEKVRKYLNPSKGDDQLSQAELDTFFKLNGISEGIKDLKTEIQELSNGLTSKIVDKTTVLFDCINSIDLSFETLINYINDKNTPPKVLNDFVDQTLASDSSVELFANMNKMHKTLIDHDINDESILSVIANTTNPKLMCNRGQSLQQTIIELHKAVVLRDSTGVAMRLYAFDQKEKRENVSYKSIRDAEITKFSRRMEKTLRALLPALLKASRQVWKCDPKQHQNGFTYSKLKVFQTHITYEDDFVELQFPSCRKTCSEFKKVLQYPSAHREGHKKSEMCTGPLRECKSISNHMTFCYAPDSSDRRYLWMKSDKGITYGHDTFCNNTQDVKSKIGDSSVYECEYCVCICETKDENIQRYFNLADVVSEHHRNKVVTGVAFKVKDNAIFIEIEQGTLGPNGTIDPKSVERKPITELRSKNRPKIVSYDPEDFYKIDWDHKSIDLDDIEPPVQTSHPKVVTGFRFRKVNNHLQLQVQTMGFDYATGTLSGFWEWHSNDKSRTEVVPLAEVDDPVLEYTHVENSRSGQYLNFQITDLHKDFGQNTVPYIDLQKVTSNPPLPLSGAGIFHKGSRGSGGFLALKLIQFDFTKYLQINQPTNFKIPKFQ